MATESILRPGELKDILLREIASADLATADVAEVGTVLEVRDGIARIYGLQSAIANEMIEFTAQETGETGADLKRAGKEAKGRPRYSDDKGSGRGGRTS